MTDNEIKILCEIRDKYCHWGEVAVMDKAINELLDAINNVQAITTIEEEK